MSNKQQHSADVLSRPLYIFDLPEELLYTLTLKNVPHVASLRTSSTTPPSPSQTRPEERQAQGRDDAETIEKPAATSCTLCNLRFATVQEQRSHVRSDLHNYNLKQQMRGLPAIEETEFEKLVGDLDESISGSESEAESDRETATKDSTLSSLLKKQAKLSQAEESLDLGKKSVVTGSPLLWFQSGSLPSNVNLGVYKAIFSKEEQEEPGHMVDALRRKQIPLNGVKTTGQKTSQYFLCMIGGGHFAAMVVSVAPKAARHGQGKNERQADVLAHKTFHRYTTRRKQGGAQSASDASRGAAHSAGSSLRRYNEAALMSEVRQLLIDWKQLIDSAELLFIRATGNTNRQTLFGDHEGRVLQQSDSRIRGFPFSTRRATQSELMRAFVELTRAKVSHFDEFALAAAQEREQTKHEHTAPTRKRLDKPAKLSDEDELATLHTNQIQSLTRRNKAPALLNYLRSNDLSAGFTFFPESTNRHAPNPLHLAASLSSPALVSALLVKAMADPTTKNADGKCAYDIAGDRATRDAFRLARHTLGESALDWDAANVGSALTPDELSQRLEQEKAEKAMAESKESVRRKHDLEKLEKEAEAAQDAKRESKFGKGKALAGAEKTGADKREEEARGMTPEMRTKLERERRARAAEDRMRRLAGNS